MDSFLPLGGFQLPFQRRLSRLYNDTKKSSDFLKEPVQNAQDPDLKALYRKLRIQKDRLVSWGLEWSDPDQSAEIDESLSKAGLSEIVGSIMSTIKETLAEAEPLWQSSKRPLSGSDKTDKAPGDRKVPLVVWDKARFEDLLRDLTASIDTLYDLSRTRSSAAMSSQKQRATMLRPSESQTLRAFESTRMQAPQQIDPKTLTVLPASNSSSFASMRATAIMSKQAYSELTKTTGRQPWAPLLLEHAEFDPIYSTTGIMPPMDRFEKLSAGLQKDTQRSPGAWSGLPRLLGSFEDMDRSRLGLVYQFPPGFKAVSVDGPAQEPVCKLFTLGDLLSRHDEPRLEAKFRLAFNLANTVFDMHARGITHGNLTHKNISFGIIADKEPHPTKEEVDIRRPVISSFDVFPDEAADRVAPDAQLYRHPLDPRDISASPLAKGDARVLDLYSLAMVLLSIGLWTQLELLTDFAQNAVPESVLRVLGVRCGTLYMKAVQACWLAADEQLTGRRSTDELLSSIQVKATGYLEACCILDGVSDLEERLGQDLSEYSPPASASKPAPSAVKSMPSFEKQPPLDLKRSAFSDDTLEAPVAWGDKPASVKPIPQDVLPRPVEKTEGTKLRLYPQVPLPPDAVERWNTIVMPQVNHALRSFYRKYPESVEISLESVGVSPQKTQPTVLVVCTSVSKVRTILKKKLGHLFEGTGGLGLKVCSGHVMRSRKQGGTPRRSMAGESTELAGKKANTDMFQARPNNGASIGAWIGDQHLPPVSFGGLVIVDDKPYGMTVHHMLDDPEAPGSTLHQDAERSTAAADTRRSQAYEESVGDSSATEDFACEFSDYSSDSDTELTSDDEDEDDEDDDYDNESEYNEPGDIPGVEPGCGDGYIITQPALDDVQSDVFKSPETEDEEHLQTYSLGAMYASSGIRRRRKSGLVHEIDWALFAFDSNRQPGHNSMPKADTSLAGPTDDGQTFYPTTVVPASLLPGLEVQCVARTSGLQTGQILPARASIRILGRTTPSDTYQVSSAVTPSGDAKGIPLGVPGDSGAWVVDRQQGRLCGHILAYSSRKHVAYICPMDVLLLDIAKTLEATEVRLPGGEAVVSLADIDVDEPEVEVGRKYEGVGEVAEESLLDLVEDTDEEAPVLVSEKQAALPPPLPPRKKGKGLVEEMEKMRIGPSVGVPS